MELDSTTSKEIIRADEKALVLVVDDDKTHHRLLELIADRLGITAHMASGCTEALEALRLVAFDIILMDYRMPEIDGCTCARRVRALKELRSDIPIIAVTANVMTGSREACLEAGMDDFLGKPFTLEELQSKLNYWLKQRPKK